MFQFEMAGVWVWGLVWVLCRVLNLLLGYWSVEVLGWFVGVLGLGFVWVVGLDLRLVADLVKGSGLVGVMWML
jgi:hypothetical protein